jgi:hypothetical protein
MLLVAAAVVMLPTDAAAAALVAITIGAVAVAARIIAAPYRG